MICLILLSTASKTYCAEECKELEKIIRSVELQIKSDEDGIKNYKAIIDDLNQFARGKTMAAIKDIIDTKLSLSTADHETTHALKEKLTTLFVSRLSVNESIDYWTLIKPKILDIRKPSRINEIAVKINALLSQKMSLEIQLNAIVKEKNTLNANEINKYSSEIKEYTWGIRRQVDDFSSAAINVSEMESSFARQKGQMELDKFIRQQFFTLQSKSSSFCSSGKVRTATHSSDEIDTPATMGKAD